MRKLLLVLLVLISCPFSSFAQGTTSSEALKAAFLFHFLNFTQWDDSSPNYNLCIPEDDELRHEARELLQDKVINNRKIQILDSSENCHVLVSNRFFSTGHVLTIGNLTRGAVMEFRVINQKLKFAVDWERVKKSKLKISSQLLKLAIVENSP